MANKDEISNLDNQVRRLSEDLDITYEEAVQKIVCWLAKVTK